MAKKQFFGIKYPFQNETEGECFMDLNQSFKEKVKSEILHVIFTPKGQRYRNPDFGTDLIKYLFEPNDEEVWGKIKSEIKTQVTKYIPRVNFKDINMYRDENDGDKLYAEISYSILKGDSEDYDNMTIRVM